MTLLIIYGLLAIAVSFLCSLLEACLLSVPRSYVESLAERGTRAGAILREMKNDIDRPLAAILTLNTIAHTFGAAGVGGQAAQVFGNKAVGVAGAVMTLLILVISEIIPKTLGAVHAKSVAFPAALTIRLLILLCLPLIIPLEWINGLFTNDQREEHLSRAELLATLRLGEASGAMHKREYQIASNLIALSTIRLAEVLTPRTVVFSLPENLTVQQALDKHHPIRFARIPVYAGDPERVTGYIPRFAIHAAHSANESHKLLKELAKPMEILPELAKVDDALDTLIKKRQHIALVVDEYGGMAGIVTLEDLLETLLGEEIVDESDTVEDMQELARRRMTRRQRRDAP
ncbi:MAG: CNNM domain-containing protein [Planctomycetota bacterium]|jgi:CBS domain containing-hemolysin-like protein